MKVLLIVASALLLSTILLSIPVDALQGKHLDSAISNVTTPIFLATHFDLFLP
jgi:hypothetical protein